MTRVSSEALFDKNGRPRQDRRGAELSVGHFKFEIPPLRAQRYQRISMTGICSVLLLYQDAPPFTAETESSILLSPVPSRGPDTRSPGLLRNLLLLGTGTDGRSLVFPGNDFCESRSSLGHTFSDFQEWTAHQCRTWRPPHTHAHPYS